MRRIIESVDAVGAEVGEEVDMETSRLIELTTKVKDLERWRTEQVNPWIINVEERLEEIDLTEKETISKLDEAVMQIKKLEKYNGCIYVRDVMILASIILTIIFIIIVLF